MSRTAIVIITGLFALGCIVALLPAEESSRRTASRFRTPSEQTPPNSLPELPPSTLTPLALPEPSPAPFDFRETAKGSRLVANDEQPTTSPSVQVAAPPTTANGNSNAFYQPPSGLIPQSPATQVAAQRGAISSQPSAEQPEATPVPTDPAAPMEEATLRSVLKKAKPALVEPDAPPLSALPRSGSSLSRAAPISSGASAPAATSRRATPIPTPNNSAPVSLADGHRAQSRSIQDMNVSSRSSALRLDVTGPQGITVGKPSAYVVHLVNESDTAAEDVVVRVALPTWVNVKSSQPTSGQAGQQGDSLGAGRIVWNVPRVGARSHEQLRLQLITTEGDGFELAVEWACKPSTAKAPIVVKQPKLHLALAGPANMTFGEEKAFTLAVTNPGTGDAERVVVAVASGTAPPQQIEVGLIPAGYKKELALQVVASQSGEMELRATASGDGNLTAETYGKITVRKAEVSVAIEGPPLKYAGTEAVYAVTVANQGNAAADNVSLSLILPSGAKYLGGVEGAAAGAGGLKWKIATLAAGSERTYELRLQLQSPGVNRLALQAQAAASGISNCQAETEVQAVSDLKLVVNDPAGPVPTGEQATYEVQVMNRGSQAAQRVRIVMQFSSGIEPISYEGCEARIVPGQVVCQPLTELGAGEQVTLRVKATAQQAGSHQFRIEVTSAEGDSRLVSEGTTRFFVEGGRPSAAATTAKRGSLVPSSTGGTLQR